MSDTSNDLANALAQKILMLVKRVAMLNMSNPDLESILNELMREFSSLQNTIDESLGVNMSTSQISSMLPEGTIDVFNMAKEEVKSMLNNLDFGEKRGKGKWKVRHECVF